MEYGWGAVSSWKPAISLKRGKKRFFTQMTTTNDNRKWQYGLPNRKYLYLQRYDWYLISWPTFVAYLSPPTPLKRDQPLITGWAKSRLAVTSVCGSWGPGKRPPGHKATGHKATPLNNYVILALYCVYRRQRKLQDITVDFKATVCEQFASTIFADLLQCIAARIWSALNMTGAQVICAQSWPIQRYKQF